MSVVVCKYDERFDRYVLGADSQLTSGQNVSTLKEGQSKVWAYEIPGFPRILMGCVGTWRDAQIVQNFDLFSADDLVSNPEGFSTKWIVNELIPRLFGLLEAFGRLGVAEEDGFTIKHMANQWVVAYLDKCFRIDQDGCVMEGDDNVCIGSGRDIAKGSIESYMGDNPFEAIEIAIRAAAHNTAYVNDIIDFDATAFIGDEMKFVTSGDYVALEEYWDEYENYEKELEEKGNKFNLLVSKYSILQARMNCLHQAISETAPEFASKIEQAYSELVKNLPAEKIDSEVEENDKQGDNQESQPNQEGGLHQEA